MRARGLAALLVLAAVACSSKVPEGSPITPGRYVARVHVGLKQKPAGELAISFAAGSDAAQDCGGPATAKGDCRIEVELGEPTTLEVKVAGQAGEARLARPDRWRTGKIMTMVASGDLAGATVVLEPAPSWLVAHGALWLAIGGVVLLGGVAGVLAARRRRARRE